MKHQRCSNLSYELQKKCLKSEFTGFTITLQEVTSVTENTSPKIFRKHLYYNDRRVFTGSIKMVSKIILPAIRDYIII